MSNEPPPTENPTVSNALFEAIQISELKDRCKAAGIDVSEDRSVIDLFGFPFYVLSLPAGRKKRQIRVAQSRLDSLLESKFEKRICVGEYVAIAAIDEHVVEAEIHPVRSGGMDRVIRLLQMPSAEEVFQRASATEADSSGGAPQAIISPTSNEIALKGAIGGVETSVRLGPAVDPLIRVLSSRPSRMVIHTIRITSPALTTHDRCLELLLQLSDAIFFQVDLLVNVPIGLTRNFAGNRAFRSRPRAAGSAKLQLPRYQYDAEPMSFFRYAREAAGMPLLQFLAYYQVLEFYFPHFAKQEAKRRLAGIIRDPTFNPGSDADLVRVLAASQTYGGNFGNERAQLQATLVGCIDVAALKAFMLEATDIKKVIEAKSSVSQCRILIENDHINVLQSVADRIYDIRCKIVHTKAGSETGEENVLLPYSSEAESLGADIELIRYIATQTLIANGRGIG